MAQNYLTSNKDSDIGNVSECIDIGVNLLTESYIDNSGFGFYIKVNGDEGMLTVVPLNQNQSIRTKFSNAGDGWNIIKCKKIIAHSGNTATIIQVGR
jgi:hypothetical protein